jgi:hypothetical protein
MAFSKERLVLRLRVALCREPDFAAIHILHDQLGSSGPTFASLMDYYLDCAIGIDRREG